MNTWIVLFRGINVGGKNILPMKELTSNLESLGCENIKTYIQSGNAVLQCKEKSAEKLAKKISTCIKRKHSFNPHIILLTPKELEKAILANPYPKAVKETKSLHLYFLSSVPKKSDLQAIEEVRKISEQYCLKNKIFYLHAPDGIGRSKLVANLEKILKVHATGRNWRTVTKIREMVIN